ncbi:MAG: signal peptidase I [Treponema sp.]
MLMVIGALFLIKYGIADIRLVVGDSMHPALHEGQYIIIWKLAYGIALPYQNTYLVRWQKPKKDDIVCYAINGQYVIKRCAATGGTHLMLARTTQKKLQTYAMLHLGGRRIPLTALQFQNLGGFLPANRRKIPDDFILALGDNAAHSYDSRDYGFVAVDSIYGKLVWK